MLPAMFESEMKRRITAAHKNHIWIFIERRAQIVHEFNNAGSRSKFFAKLR